MTKPQAQVPFRQRAIFTKPIFNRYTVGWSMLGVLSVGYIAILALSPDLLDDLTPANGANPQSNQDQRAAARLKSEVGTLHESVSQIQFDLAKIKTDSQGYAERQNALASQVGGLEQKLSSLAHNKVDALAPATPNGASGTQAAVDSVSVPDAVAPPAATPPAAPNVQGSTQQPAVINAGTPVTTGTLPVAAKPQPQITTAATDAINLGPAIVKPAPKPMGIKISSGASVDALRLSWSLLAERHGDTLKNLQARYTTGGDAENPNYDLIAGPLKSTAEAKKVCKALAAKNVPCQVGAFAGASL